mgnify:CR=1 FL=1
MGNFITKIEIKDDEQKQRKQSIQQLIEQSQQKQTK